MFFVAAKPGKHNEENANNKAKQRPAAKPKTKPKILNHLKYVLLIVFITLLAAQLGALELAPSVAISSLTNVTEHNQLITQSNDVSAFGSAPPSIDRHDRDAGGDAQLVWPTLASGSELRQPIMEDAPRLANGSQWVDSLLTKDNKGRTTTQAAPTAVFGARIDTSTNDGDLMAAPSANAIQLPAISGVGVQEPTIGAPLEDMLKHHVHMSESQPSLADMTALGTATGLMVHDMMAQADSLPASTNEASAGETPYLAPLATAPMPAAGSIETPFPAASSEPGDSGGVDEEELDAVNFRDANGDERRPARIYSSYLEARGPQLGEAAEVSDLDEQLVANTERTRDAASGRLQRAMSQPTGPARAPLAADAPEPFNEDQIPDSMDSLMRSEGESAEDVDGSDASQLAAGTQLVNQNDNPTRRAQQHQHKASELAEFNQDANDSDGGGDDPDDSENKPPAGMRQQMAQQEAIAPDLGGHEIDSSLPDLSGTNFVPVHANEVHPGTGLTDAPMRDSLADLNTAAGHYYKKKKKKVKKVVYKKKKKKKKYAKKKKVKMYKVVIKKKKKKKPKKMKKHHHHDHGKYYMYAKVPKKKAWEFGFKKGNKKHWIERHEKGHKNKFKTKVKWYDKKSKGKGVHIWDYNHYDKKKKKHYRR